MIPPCTPPGSPDAEPVRTKSEPDRPLGRSVARPVAGGEGAARAEEDGFGEDPESD